MADAGMQRSNDPRRLLAETVTPPAPREPIVSARAWAMSGWIGVLAAGMAAIMTMLQLAWDEVGLWSLANASPAEAEGALDGEWAGSTSPDYLETIAELSLQASPPDEAAAWLAAKRAVELDPSRAFAWATVAYLETRQAGGVNETAIGALTRSMEACPLCDQDLVRWRFNYVLANWNDMPEPLRRKAFEHADLLRWIGPNAEFLAEMRFKARLQGIPFDAYRAAVDTPAPSWDIAPVTP